MTPNPSITRNPFLTLAVLMSAMMVGAIVALAGETKPADKPADAPSTTGQPSAGDPEMLYNNACRTCHSIKPGDNRLGPSLGGIIGMKAGSQEGFQYSPPMKQAGITWDEKTLDAFIANPDQVVQGNTMKPYTGMTDAGHRAKIIEYLKKGG